MKKNMKKSSKIRPPVCPYCGSRSVLRDASYVYHEKQFETHLYVCSRYPSCDSYVGVHKDGFRPKGTLANSELRNRRIIAHKVFDEIWRSGIMSRRNAYCWLQDITGLTESQAHIGMFSEYSCDQLIKACNEVLARNNHTKKEVA